jgi:uncharacterized protein YcbX
LSWPSLADHWIIVMRIKLGTIEAIFRYPVKSMRGERLEAAMLGWHGIDGDRRFAFRRIDAPGGFPWLSAGRLPDLINFTPLPRDDGNADAPPTHVLTPEGERMELMGKDLAATVSRRHGHPVEMMQLKHGIFDEAAISVIAAGTVAEICRLGGVRPDVRRFRPNILMRTAKDIPLEEDQWVGGMLTFGEGDAPPAVSVTMRDLRCVMLNLDPDGGKPSPEVMRAAVRANDNNAGVYGAVTRTGRIAVGQTIMLRAEGAATRLAEGVA